MGQGGRGAYALNVGGQNRVTGAATGLNADSSAWKEEVPLFETAKGAAVFEFAADVGNHVHRVAQQLLRVFGRHLGVRVFRRPMALEPPPTLEALLEAAGSEVGHPHSAPSSSAKPASIAPAA